MLQKLEDRLTSAGSKVLEVSYNDADHARLAIQGLPAFDACVVQSSFKIIAIQTLQAIREKASGIILHGLGLTGTEVDCIGHDWGSSVSQALRILSGKGHKQIGFVTTDRPFMANLMGIRRFLNWCDERQYSADEYLIRMPVVIQGDYEMAVAETLQQKRKSTGKLPFTALICWGVEHHARLLEAMSLSHIKVPEELSVILLGGPDEAQNHSSAFTTLGSTAELQAEGIFKNIGERLANPTSAPKVTFLPAELYEGTSVHKISK
ncbi:substrate-binding domain-containing protein [Erwinia sp. E_sp_W01_6]|uniref:substrate-binding domain-containing protein n=1 Tax=unclassified Erwinia TaxID=2622719 RepID=UPI0030CBE17D